MARRKVSVFAASAARRPRALAVARFVVLIGITPLLYSALVAGVISLVACPLSSPGPDCRLGPPPPRPSRDAGAHARRRAAPLPGAGLRGDHDPAIAAAAGVAVPTIYWAFGSKRAIVGEIRAAWLAEAGTATRLREVLAVEEAGARLEAYAAFMGNQWATGAEALAIQQDAMRADAEIAAEVAAVLAERAERLKAILVPLVPRLRAGLGLETAHDILLALSLLEVYRELRARGWTTSSTAPGSGAPPRADAGAGGDPARTAAGQGSGGPA